MSVYQNIVNRTPIDKGWSGDQKYCAVTADGTKYLLRISSIDRLERKHREYEKMSEVAQLGIPMCLPVEFGTCEEGAYSIQSWIDGEDAEELVMSMDEEKQYRYGLDAGRILAKIHTVPAPVDALSWETRFNGKIDRKIAMYENCELKYESGGDAFLSCLAENRHLLSGRPQSYQHGDYHIGNMMIDRNGTLTIIDFDRDDFGDPWEEFNRIVWCAQAAPAFASGMVDGYFDGKVPMEFWKLLALYISSNTLSSLPWAIPFGEGEIQVMRKQAAQVLEWYDGMKNVVPTWYRKDTSWQHG
ncbi:MAG: phosphotransferase [Oscillospiraceae bacterium]|nr:phosphotransferase [Oscillospiraceae bacterium]